MLLLWHQAIHGSLLSRESRRTLLDEFKPDVVLHLAWQPISSPTYETSPAHSEWSQATLEFVTECNQRNIWFLCAGSAIDDRQRSASHLESSSYLVSKRQLRDHFSTLMRSQQMMTWLQIQYVFSVAAMRPRLLRAVIESDAPSDFQPNNPTSLHDFIHIDDVATAISCILMNRVTGTISVGTGFLISTTDFVESVKFKCGHKKEKRSIRPVKTLAAENRLRLFDWSPKASCEFFDIDLSEI